MEHSRNQVTELQSTLQQQLEIIQQLNSTQLELLRSQLETFTSQLNRTQYDIRAQLSHLQSYIQGVDQLTVESGGWTKVSNLDMTDLDQQCPNGFKQINRTEPPLRTCGRPDGSGSGCVSTTFPV